MGTGLAHELRNPLSTLRLNLQLLQEEWQNPVTDRERKGVRKIDTLLRETERLQAILDNFLRFAGGHTLHRQPVDLHQLLSELLGFIGPPAEKADIRIVRKFAPHSPRIQADPDLLRQAITNLLINAQEAMPGGGTLTVHTEWIGKTIRLTIEDTGKGIDPSVTDRVFDLYYSTKPAGSGLGLPITRKIIEEHEGSIVLRPGTPHGTLAILELPHE